MNEKLQMSRHSLAHVLAKAIKRLYPDAKMAIGPSIDDGFYYDFDYDAGFKMEDASLIEKEMKKIINNNEPFRKEYVTKEEARKLFEGNPYKLELIDELSEGEITVYYLGDDFYDLCAGPHVENTSKLQNYAFKINRINGAYWRGSEKNKMLQRIYVYAFASSKELSEHIKSVEEALKRDHNKLGRELEIFTTSPMVGQGLPIMLPKGAKIIQTLQRFVEDEEAKRGYLLTMTPYMTKKDLFITSGHWDHYKDGMFILGDPESDDCVCLRPMTCPFQYQAYLNRTRSYKDLPLRYNETSKLFRKEASGEMHGLIRVSQFTLSEGHIMCTPEQLSKEFKDCVELARFMLKSLGLYEDVSYRFSKWDENDKDKYIGSKEEWEEVQGAMRDILNDMGLDYFEADGEAAFYGPKLDIQIKNVFGKEDTLITVQIDFQSAKRFGMEYTDKDGVKKNPYVIHRSSIGCYERTLALLIEKYAGALPVWLSPTQIMVMNVAQSSEEYANEVYDSLVRLGYRVEKDIRNEKIGYKIREAVANKIPYMVILGDNEVNNKTISIRKRGNVSVNDITINELADLVNKDIEDKI